MNKQKQPITPLLLDHAARRLHVVASELRERFIALGVFDEALAHDFDELAAIASWLATDEANARAASRPSVTTPR